MSTAGFWMAIGAGMALVFMYVQAQGSWASLLRVGARNPALDRIQSELGPVHPPDPVGHDGQLTYLIARDPFGLDGTPAIISAVDNNGPAYRYRRIFLPLLAGGAGTLNGKATLILLIALVAAGLGVSYVAVADLAFQQKVKGGSALLAMINAGALNASMLLMVDTMALGLALCGLALRGRQHFRWSAFALACAAMTKETYALVPLSLAAWDLAHRRYPKAALGMASVAPIALWSVWTAGVFPGGAGGDRNLGLPFAGLIQAIPHWIRHERFPPEIVLAVFGVLTFAGTAVCLARAWRAPSAYLLWPWFVLGLCSTILVWGKPHNAARSFAILWPLMVLQLARSPATRPLDEMGDHSGAVAPGSRHSGV
jgi:hypothetical protein